MDVQKVTAFLIGIIAVFAIGFVLDVAQPVVLPLVIALLFSFLMTPAMNFLMKRWRFPRGPAIFLIIIIIFGIIFLLGWFVFSSAQSFVRQYSKYEARFDEIFTDIMASKYLAGLDLSENLFSGFNWQRTLRDSLFSISGSFMTFVGVTVIITIVLIFLFLETPHFKIKLSKAFPPHTSKRIGIMLEHITRQVSRYLGVKLFISFMTGMTVSVTLAIIGMDFPIIWGALAFLLNFIPQVGSIMFVAISILMSIVQFYPTITDPITVAITMTGIQLLFGQFLDPLMSGERLNLSPVIILASLVFWAWLWGVVGAFIAVPIAATIKIICANIPFLKPVSVLMGIGYKRKRRLFKKPRN